MFDEHMFEVRYVENPTKTFIVNLKDYICSSRRWDLIGLSCVQALSDMKSKNFKIDDYIPEYYRKSRYTTVYKHVIYLVNGSNLWVKTPYMDLQPPKYRKMSGRQNNMRNLKQGEID